MSIRKKENILGIKLWLFVLIFLMIFSGVSMAQEAAKDSEYLQKIALCKDILEKNPLRQTNFFFPQDEKVVTWLRFSHDSPEKFVLRWEWITPQGKLYRFPTILQKILYSDGNGLILRGKYITRAKWRWKPVIIVITAPGIG